MATRNTATKPTPKTPRAAVASKPAAGKPANDSPPEQPAPPAQSAQPAHPAAAAPGDISGAPAGADAGTTPTAAATPAAEAPAQIECVIVTSRPETRRRAGMRFTREPMGIALEALSPEQLQALEADPELILQYGSVDAATTGDQ